MNGTPDVSIIIPVHNRADLLMSALRSCQQSAPGLDLQIIVIDDASTEDLSTVLARSPIDFERLPLNQGSSVARNHGLDRVRGRYVKFLDSDDALVPSALRREFDAAAAEDADIVVAGWSDTRLDQQGRDQILKTFEASRFDSIVDDLLAGKAAPTSGALYAARIAVRARWDPALAKLNDWDYFVSAALNASRIVTVEGPAYYWRQHDGVRITSSTNFVGNALEFYAILLKLEATLRSRDLLTPARARRLAQYMYKELRGLYRFGREERHAILSKIFELDPRFVPCDEEHSLLVRSLSRVLPLRWMLTAYGVARGTVDRLHGRQP